MPARLPPGQGPAAEFRTTGLRNAGNHRGRVSSGNNTESIQLVAVQVPKISRVETRRLVFRAESRLTLTGATQFQCLVIQGTALGISMVPTGAEKKVVFDYTDLREQSSRRSVRPLALTFFGPVWLLLAWCEGRRDFRNFRLDRIRNMEYTGRIYAPDRDKSLARYLEIEEKKRC